MLRLNPNDNQGIRYLLVSCLLEVGDDAAIESLLNDYEGDIAAELAYAKALFAYLSARTRRRTGPIAVDRRLSLLTWLAKTVADLPPPKTVRSTALH